MTSVHLATQKRRSPLKAAFVATLRNSLKRSGGDVHQMANEFGVSHRTVNRWITGNDLRGELERLRRQAAA